MDQEVKPTNSNRRILGTEQKETLPVPSRKPLRKESNG